MEVNVMAREYSLVIIDIDFFLRYCIRYTDKESESLMDNIKTLFVNAFAGMNFFHQDVCD